MLISGVDNYKLWSNLVPDEPGGDTFSAMQAESESQVNESDAGGA